MEKEKRESLRLFVVNLFVVNTLILVVSLFGRGDRVIGLYPSSVR